MQNLCRKGAIDAKYQQAVGRTGNLHCSVFGMLIPG